MHCSSKQPSNINHLINETTKRLGARAVGQEAMERVTVTSLRTYLQSPRLFYLQHVLKLQEVLAAPQEMGPNHFGTLIHSVLAAFGSEASLTQSTDAKLIAGWLRKKLFEVAQDYFSSATSPVIPLQLEEAAKSLEGFATAQAAHRRAGWRIIATEPFLKTKAPPLEEKIILPDDRSIVLQGRIDRVDWHPEKERWLVIDYKTSNSKSWERATPDATHYQKKGEAIIWRDLQLPLYLKLVPRLGSVLKSGFPLPNPENTDLCYFQLPLESEKARLTLPFNHAMIEPAWKEAERVVGRILDHDFEELGKIDAKRTPTLAALCGIAGLWSPKKELVEEETNF
jgi:ATP-dependent exoDNAse (exonuclease V) beta subunit